MKKKIVSLLLICCFCVTSFLLMGCSATETGTLTVTGSLPNNATFTQNINLSFQERDEFFRDLTFTVELTQEKEIYYYDASQQKMVSNKTVTDNVPTYNLKIENLSYNAALKSGLKIEGFTLSQVGTFNMHFVLFGISSEDIPYTVTP